VKLMGSNQYDALLINDSAIGTDQTVRYVLVVGADNKVQYRPVKLGPIIDGLRVVTDGLKPGETIVVNGLQRVRPGSPVTPDKVAMGERERGDKPQTLYAHNSKLAWNMTPVSTTPAKAADAVWLGGEGHATAGAATSVTSQKAPVDIKPSKADDHHSTHVALNNPEVSRPNSDATSANN